MLIIRICSETEGRHIYRLGNFCVSVCRSVCVCVCALVVCRCNCKCVCIRGMKLYTQLCTYMCYASVYVCVVFRCLGVRSIHACRRMCYAAVDTYVGA